jgi:hypothetical protein
MRRTTIMSRRDMTTGTVGAWIGVDVACSSSAIVRVIVSLRPKPSKEVKEELSVCAPTLPSIEASRSAVR